MCNLSSGISRSCSVDGHDAMVTWLVGDSSSLALQACCFNGPAYGVLMPQLTTWAVWLGTDG